jgi:hypothetical protein
VPGLESLGLTNDAVAVGKFPFRTHQPKVNEVAYVSYNIFGMNELGKELNAIRDLEKEG